MNEHFIEIELPGVLSVIARTVGLETALKLARRAGGTQINIPKKMRPTSRIAAIVGKDAAEVIRREVGHGKIIIPLTGLRGPASKRAAAVKLLEQGMSVAEVAQAVNVHERTVYRVQKEYRKLRDERVIRGV